jgi:hypothetical protein
MAGVQVAGNRVEILESKKKEMVKMEITQEQLNEMLKKAQSDAVSSFDSKISDFDEQRRKLEELYDKNMLLESMRSNEQSVKGRIANADYKFSRFTAPQQKVIVENLDYSGTAEDVMRRLDEKVQFMDAAVASAKLESRGFTTAYSPSQVNVEVGETAIPGGERIAKLSEAVSHVLSIGGQEPEQMSSRLIAHKNEVMRNFARLNHQTLLNEADTMGAANLPTVNQYSAVVIEQSFQQMTALNLCDLGTMNSSPMNMFLETYSESAAADINALKVPQGGVMKKTATTVTKFPVYSEILKLSFSLSEEALVAARSANNYALEARSIAALVNDFTRREDKFIYALMSAKANCHSTVNVSTAETLTQLGTTTTWYSTRGGRNYLQNPTSTTAAANKNLMWVKNEFIKKFDVNNNLAATYIVRSGTDISSTLQPVVVVDSSVVAKTLIHGYLQSDGSVRTVEGDIESAIADYYVLYPDGAIVISDAPATVGLTAPYKAKYTYTKNARVWMMTPPSGVKFEDHLKELHLVTGQVKSQLLSPRHYVANFLAASISTTDMISNSALYRQSGSNVANVINPGGLIERFAGLPPTSSPIMPDNEIIVGVKGSAGVWSHVPYKITEPIRLPGVAEVEYQAIETKAIDCIISGKLAIIGIGQ